jgi:ubiquitin-conjugating enzyme E2 G1
MSTPPHPSTPPPKPGTPASAGGAAIILSKQLKQMQTDKDIPGISVGLVDDKNLFEWEVMLMIGDDVKYYGGTYTARRGGGLGA